MKSRRRRKKLDEVEFLASFARIMIDLSQPPSPGAPAPEAIRGAKLAEERIIKEAALTVNIRELPRILVDALEARVLADPRRRESETSPSLELPKLVALEALKTMLGTDRSADDLSEILAQLRGEQSKKRIWARRLRKLTENAPIALVLKSVIPHMRDEFREAVQVSFGNHLLMFMGVRSWDPGNVVIGKKAWRAALAWTNKRPGAGTANEPKDKFKLLIELLRACSDDPDQIPALGTLKAASRDMETLEPSVMRWSEAAIKQAPELVVRQLPLEVRLA